MLTRAAIGILLLLPASNAAAESSARSFAELSQRIRTGDTGSITDRTGQRVKGKVSDLSGSSITIAIKPELRVSLISRARRRR
jgi:hypothetical protein